MYLYQKTYKKTAFRVKKPIRSFRDLEVYQRTSCAATEIMTKVMPLLGEGNSWVKEKLVDCCLKIPESIATAHSHRFETGEELKFLEDAKDIEGRALCDDLIKRYILVRRKIFNLYRAWKKFQKIP